MSEIDKDLAESSVNTIRFLAADAIQKAKSGHPGLPLGAAPMAYVLWSRHMKFNPEDPDWADRDRFVLSAGHGSALLYSILHLTGYEISIDDLKRFRQTGSKTPGHPENFLTPGVEATTGPLGQGFANAVGMAIAEAHLAAVYNRPGHEIVDHHTYVLAGDGDLMEGVCYEAASLAGHLKLGKLIVLYDDNSISLAGTTNLAFTEDVKRRFEAQGWQVLTVHDGNDLDAIDDAIAAGKAETLKPTLICVRTVIGYGSPHKAGSYQSHGAPLGEEELAATKDALGWPKDKNFYVPEDVREHMNAVVEKRKATHSDWMDLYCYYVLKHSDLPEEFVRRTTGDLPDGWEDCLSDFSPDDAPIATRVASERAMQEIGKVLPELFGGSADLNPSVFARLKDMGDFQPPRTKPGNIQGAVGGVWDYSGRNLHFGVREHAMGSIAVGLALHGGILPFTGTFFIFSDYMRPPMRLAALSGKRIVFVFSHDSIGVGEDGPTHQPVEQLMNLRAVPNLNVIRPADANEVNEAWKIALSSKERPTALVFSRQKLPILNREKYLSAEGLQKGAYVLWQSSDGIPNAIIIGTGSEVHIALEAAEKLAEEKINIRVVSMPCWSLFDEQPEEYRRQILPPEVRARVAVEAGSRLGWERYVGLDGVIIGMDGFGASAPANELSTKFGITANAVYSSVKALLTGGE